MSLLSLQSIVFTLLAEVFATCVFGQTRTQYSILDLGDKVTTVRLNNRGHAAIDRGLEPSQFWNGSSFIDLPPTNALWFGDINDNDEIVGPVLESNSAPRSLFVWRNGSVFTFSPPQSLGICCQPLRINNAGIIAGTHSPFVSPTLAIHAFRLAGNAFTDLGVIRGPITGQSFTTAINNLSQILGTSLTGSGSVPFVWENGIFRELATLPGTSFGINPGAINDSGQIVMCNSLASPAVGVGTTFWQNSSSQPQPLNAPAGHSTACAADMNDGGVIVGDSRPASFLTLDQLRAVVWEGGAASDLNLRLPPTTDWVLHSATTVNNRGQIGGIGSRSGIRHGFIVTPEFSLTQTTPVFSRLTRRFSSTVTVTNLGGSVGSLAVAADGLPSGVSLLSPSGFTTASAAPAGSPYIEFGTIGMGQTLSVVLEFTRTAAQSVVFTARVLDGAVR